MAGNFKVTTSFADAQLLLVDKSVEGAWEEGLDLAKESGVVIYGVDGVKDPEL